MLVLGSATFAAGAYQLFVSGVGSVVSSLIVGGELAVSLAVYLMLRRRWVSSPARTRDLRAFGGRGPRG